MEENSLQHYGVLGMKWGIRRYQEKGGSYTKAGIARYNKSKNTYENQKKKYDELKKDDSFETYYDRKYAKSKVKEAKREMKNDYKRLKNDLTADKGKVRYNNGERIRSNNRTAKALAMIGALSIYASAATRTYSIGSNKTDVALAAIGAASMGASLVKSAVDLKANKELSAYYSHSSKK